MKWKGVVITHACGSSLHKHSNRPKLSLMFASAYVNTHATYYFFFFIIQCTSHGNLIKIAVNIPCNINEPRQSMLEKHRILQESGEGEGAESVYLEKYWRYENETRMVCKASKNVYFSDSHMSITTWYHAKMTSYIQKIHFLGSVIWDFQIVQKCQKKKIWECKIDKNFGRNSS